MDYTRPKVLISLFTLAAAGLVGCSGARAYDSAPATPGPAKSYGGYDSSASGYAPAEQSAPDDAYGQPAAPAGCRAGPGKQGSLILSTPRPAAPAAGPSQLGAGAARGTEPRWRTDRVPWPRAVHGTER